jgi:tetratricopeptide (TPR) repeat protein
MEDTILRAAREVDAEDPLAVEDEIVKLQSLVDQGSDNANVPYEIAILQANRAADVISKELVAAKFAASETQLKVKPAFQIYRQIEKQHASEPIPRLEKLIAAIQLNVEPHVVALRSAVTDSLLHCPLAPEPRFLAIIAETDLELSPAYQHYSGQLLALRRFSRSPLGMLADLAGERSDWETTTQALRNIAKNSPTRVVSLLRTAEQMGHPNPPQLVPDDDVAMMLAANQQIRTGKVDLEFYQRALNKLSESFPEDRYERSDRMVTLAGLNEMLGNTEQSLEDYLRAIELDSGNMETRIAYIEALARAGELVQAKRYAEELDSASEGSKERLKAVIRRVQRQLDDKNSN